MIKNLWDELYQLENKQAKGAKHQMGVGGPKNAQKGF